MAGVFFYSLYFYYSGLGWEVRHIGITKLCLLCVVYGLFLRRGLDEFFGIGESATVAVMVCALRECYTPGAKAPEFMAARKRAKQTQC